MHSLRGLGTFGKARSLSDVSEDVGLSDSEGGVEDKCLDITRNHGFLMLSALWFILSFDIFDVTLVHLCQFAQLVCHSFSCLEGKFELPLSLTLQLLLEHCEMWIENVDINQEMPDLSFHVSGANGQKQKLNISPHSYVLAKGMDVEAGVGFSVVSPFPSRPDLA